MKIFCLILIAANLVYFFIATSKGDTVNQIYYGVMLIVWTILVFSYTIIQILKRIENKQKSTSETNE